MNHEGCDRKLSWHNVKYYLGICPQEPKETMRNYQLRYPVSGPRFEHGTYPVRTKSAYRSARDTSIWIVPKDPPNVCPGLLVRENCAVTRALEARRWVGTWREDWTWGMLRSAGARRARPSGSYRCSRGHQVCLRPRAAVPEDAVHRADAGDRVRVANPLRQ